MTANILPTVSAALEVLQSHGLLFLVPLAVIEGPIVTVVAAYLARLGDLNIVAVYCAVVAADLAGDSLLYFVGRSGGTWMPASWRRLLGLTEARLAGLEDHFQTKGGRTLIAGKLTHSAGLAILLAAGASRMPFPRYLFFNFVGTVPKSLFFCLIGYFLGFAYRQIDSYIFRTSAVILVLVLFAAFWWFLQRRKG